MNWTSRDVQRLFDVTPMTVYNWMKGSPRRTALPVVRTPCAVRARISFNPDAVIEWATANGIDCSAAKRARNRDRAATTTRGADQPSNAIQAR